MTIKDKVTSIIDFKSIIKAIDEVEANFQNEEYKNRVNDMANKILLISNPIISCNFNSEENIQAYSKICVSFVEKLKFNKVDKIDFEKWLDCAKLNVAAMFITKTINLRNSDVLFQDSDDELDELLLNFFNGESLLIVMAYFLSVRRYAKKNPMFCYDKTIELFEKHPDFIYKFDNDVKYVYDKSKITDVKYDTCQICYSSDVTPYLCVNQAILSDNNFSPAKLWMKCNNCGNLFNYNFPLPRMGDFAGHCTKKNENGLLKPRNMLSIYGDIFNEIRKFNQGKDYLEIGIGNGEMLAVALEMGYNVSAIEICKEDCENISGALNVDIVWSDFLLFETNKKFDLIVMGDVLEHVSRPIDALKKAYDLLNNNGILWLSTPNFDSAFSRMRKFMDPMWNQKTHFTYFSYKGLKPFLDKIGFEVKRYDVSNRYNGSMELILQKI